MMSKSIIILICTFHNLLALSAQTTAKQRKQQFNIENGVAIQGYDPVAYFKSGKAVKGSKTFAVNADGIIYYCSSAANKALLLKNYKAYEPRYGGWCAYAMGAKGQKVNVNPETFKIVNGQLYLFYNAYFNNTLDAWNRAEDQLKKAADLNWLKFITP